VSPDRPATTAARTCHSRRIGHWGLIVRSTVRVTGLRASFEGRRAPVRRTTRNGRQAYVVTINMRGLRHGIYTGRVRYRLTRLSTGSSRRWTKVHHWRVCYGHNPEGGLPEGHNQFPLTIL
jgi:hypothetical protein